jgi:tRNA modification GTPase
MASCETMNSMTASDSDAPTRLAWLTPPGKAAIAVLALRGPRAWDVVRELFQPVSGRPLPESPPDAETGRFWLGWLGRPGRGERDEVVVAVKRNEPAPWVEVHCHGGRQMARLLEELFQTHGLQVCSWQELEQLTGADPERAAILAALAQAPTVRTAAILLDQYHGAFDRARAEVQAASQRGDQQQVVHLLKDLARFVPVGRHLTVPWRIAILGVANVGKSSLANRLAGYQRSIVSPIPGTTRDLVTTTLAVDGWPVELIDTAGWRSEAESLEEQGIALARRAAAEADLCLWLLDASAPPQWPEADLPGLRYLINKIDLAPAWELEQVPQAMRISALTGAGLPELLEALSRWLVPEPPPAGAAVPFTPAERQWVETELRSLANGVW